MSDLRYMRPELLEGIARNTLKQYDPMLIMGSEIKSIRIEDIIEHSVFLWNISLFARMGAFWARPCSTMTMFPCITPQAMNMSLY